MKKYAMMLTVLCMAAAVSVGCCSLCGKKSDKCCGVCKAKCEKNCTPEQKAQCEAACAAKKAECKAEAACAAKKAECKAEAAK